MERKMSLDCVSEKKNCKNVDGGLPWTNHLGMEGPKGPAKMMATATPYLG